MSRRSRRFVSETLPWEPTMRDPLRGVVIWPVPENKQLSVTLFKDPRSNEHEDKEWTFAIEDVSNNVTLMKVNTISWYIILCL